MKKNYKMIAIFIEPSDTLLGVPSGKSKKYQIALLDLLFLLAPPYNTVDLEEFLTMIFEKCFSEVCKDDEYTSIEKYYGIKGYVNARNKLRCVSIDWLDGGGYKIRPTKNARKNGFQYLVEKIIPLETDYKPGELAKAFLKAVELSS